MTRLTVSMPDQMNDWVEAQIESGRYGNVSEYLRDLIRRDQERQLAIDEIQRAITEGFASGAPRAFDFSAFLQRKRQERNEAAS